jgi:membrane-associated phospholipid phosphatase
VRSSEWVSVIYFAAMTIAAWLRPLPASRRIRISMLGVVMCAAFPALAGTAPVLRDWVSPALAILAGYYLSGLFFVRSTPWFEAWLAEWDRRVLGDPAARFADWPRFVLAYLDVLYIGCFLLVPAGFAVLALAGRAADANHYWTMVIAAELGSFLPLAVLQSRPPWMIERKAMLPDRAVHRAASIMVEHLTIRANTFPSGHVAGSLAVALAVIGVMPVAGLVFLVLAASIAAGCVVGRYHYIIDVVAGIALTLAIWAVVT